MTPASAPAQRPADAKLLVLAADGGISHATRAGLPAYVRSGDVVVGNDAATIPASLAGAHERTGATVEVRLAGWRSRIGDFEGCLAVVFGEGDYRTRTEHRPAAPDLRAGDRLRLGPLRATVVDIPAHPRLVALAFDGGAASVWAGLAAHGRPIQYAHVPEPLALRDVWTPLAAPPAAFEPPSAGFALDARLPLAEPYEIPAATVRAVARARACGGRVIAVGTTVVRALEHAALRGALRAGSGVADQRIGPATPLRIVDVLLTGTHEAGTSHYELLRAFARQRTLRAMSDALDAGGYRTHEFGDSVLVARELPCAAAVGS